MRQSETSLLRKCQLLIYNLELVFTVEKNGLANVVGMQVPNTETPEGEVGVWIHTAIENR